MREMIEYAIGLSRQAGALLLKYHAEGRIEESIRTKLGHFDLVTAADLASEQLILEALQREFPGHAVYSEESADGRLPDAEWLWLVDPVDGTANYAHRLPLYSVTLALAHRGAPVLGVIHDPSAARTYWAGRGLGAYVRTDGSDARLAVSGVPVIERSVLATGFAYERHLHPDSRLTDFLAMDGMAQSVRRLGCATLALAWVAAGYLDAYWEAWLKPWDFAAGWLLVEEAGGRVSDYAGRALCLDGPTLLASNGRAGVYEPIQRTVHGPP